MPEITVPAEAFVLGGTFVHVHNDETDAYWDSPVDYLPTAIERGWAPVAPEVADVVTIASPVPVPGADVEVEQTSFDPTDHDVQSVNDYLAQHAESAPGEVARVLEIEDAGQARKGVMHGPFGTPAED